MGKDKHKGSPMNMKVAYLVGGLPFGGIERWLYDLSLEYMRNGLLHPRVFNLSGSGNLLPEYVAANIDLWCVVDNNIKAIATHRLDTTMKLRKLLKDFKPDIIHTMHFTANHHGRLASIGLGAPVITHLRNIKHERKAVRRFSDKVLSYATTMYLAVSQAVAQVVQNDHNLAKRPVKVLYNAVNPNRLDCPPIDLKAEFGLTGQVVVAVGRYVPQKNLDLLIKAVSVLRDRGADVSLVLVGEGPERPALEALTAALGLTKNVVLAGFRPDVPAFYQAADIFAMPSDFEGLPIAHLEAMYFGLPAVVSEFVPSLEIASGASLVCDLSPEGIADKIDRIISDDALRKQLSRKAVEAAQPHTMENYAKTLYGVYQEVLSGKANEALGKRGHSFS